MLDTAELFPFEEQLGLPLLDSKDTQWLRAKEPASRTVSQATEVAEAGVRRALIG